MLTLCDNHGIIFMPLSKIPENCIALQIVTCLCEGAGILYTTVHRVGKFTQSHVWCETVKLNDALNTSSKYPLKLHFCLFVLSVELILC